jgi:hypothetical protein
VLQGAADGGDTSSGGGGAALRQAAHQLWCAAQALGARANSAVHDACSHQLSTQLLALQAQQQTTLSGLLQQLQLQRQRQQPLAFQDALWAAADSDGCRDDGAGTDRAAATPRLRLAASVARQQFRLLVVAEGVLSRCVADLAAATAAAGGELRDV